jgi:hypothetical protein
VAPRFRHVIGELHAKKVIHIGTKSQHGRLYRAGQVPIPHGPCEEEHGPR